jgi:hypothetical protein
VGSQDIQASRSRGWVPAFAGMSGVEEDGSVIQVHAGDGALEIGKARVH